MVVVLIVIAVVVTAVVVGGGGGSTTVTLEALGTRPSHPFTTSVVSVPTSELNGFRTSLGGNRGRGGSSGLVLNGVSGAQDSLYGADPGRPVCSTPQLISDLRADPQLGKAWAQAMGVSTGDVGSTIDGLTPLVLGQDTAVTTDGYEGGAAVASQAILEAGTPVLVDAHGAPRVQCSSGDPLSPPSTAGTHVKVVGTPWPGFSPTAVVAVTPSPQPLPTIQAVSITTHQPVSVAPGGARSVTGYLVLGRNDVRVESAGGENVLVLAQPEAEAVDDGQGGLVYQAPHPPALNQGMAESLQQQLFDAPASADQATIWWLPAGAAAPVKAVDGTGFQTHWPIIDAAGTLGGQPVLLYEDVPGGTSGQAAPDLTAALHLRYLRNGRDVVIAQLSGEDATIVAAAVTGDRVVYATSGEGSVFWNYLGADLRPQHNACTGGHEAGSVCATGQGVDARGQILSFDVSQGGQGLLGIDGLEVIDPSTATAARTITLPSSPFVGSDFSYTQLAVAGEEAILFNLGPPPQTTGPAEIIDLSTGGSQRVDVDGPVVPLQAPLVLGAQTTPAVGPSSTTTTPTDTLAPSPSTLAPPSSTTTPSGSLLSPAS